MREAAFISPAVFRHELQSLCGGRNFAPRFEAKDRFREYLKAIPVNVITHPAAAFVGLTSVSRTVEWIVTSSINGKKAAESNLIQ
jgi:glucokinase